MKDVVWKSDDFAEQFVVGNRCRESVSNNGK